MKRGHVSEKNVVCSRIIRRAGGTWFCRRHDARIASAEESRLQISDIAGRNTYLMSDGSMWSLIDGRHAIRTPGKVATISGYEYEGIGMTQDGRLVEWDIGKGPEVVPGTSGVKQIAGSYWLKSDGTVWGGSEKAKPQWHFAYRQCGSRICRLVLKRGCY